MDPEEVLNLFDSYWFHQQIFTKQPVMPHIQDTETHKQPENPPISRISSHHVRSLSDQLSSATSFCSDSTSPKSVLLSDHKLQPILSGKEVTEEVISPNKDDNDDDEKKKEDRHHRKKVVTSKRRMKKGRTKSLSDLEFEELKGFIDLGFVFSEEDKNSSLVSIIPGLQKLGKDIDQEEEEEGEEDQRGGVISRPYLSEAWGVLDRRKDAINKPRIDWTVPALGSEIDMKDHLRHWAHTVASAVR